MRFLIKLSVRKMHSVTEALIPRYEQGSMKHHTMLETALFALAATHPLTAAEHTVCAGSCDHTSIAAAIAIANGGDTITVMDALHTEQGIVVDKDLTISGMGADSTIIQSDGTDRVFNINSGTVVTLRDAGIQNGNTAQDGGAIFNAGTLTLQNCSVSGNTAGGYGGGIYNDSADVTITNSTISNNSAGKDGGGISHNWGTMQISHSTVSGNTADDGGGIENFYSELTLTNSTISDNNASKEGGGIYNYNYAELTLTNCTISGNRAIYGGGISNYSDSTATVKSSTVSGNTATQDGGGISSYHLTELTITNSTISGNEALEEGGGIYSTDALQVTSSTISGNAAVTGGGMYLYRATATIVNSIIADSGGGDCTRYGGNLSTANSLLESSGSDACSLTNGVNGVLTGTDPKLGALGDNGGPTLTHMPAADSPALDKVPNTQCDSNSLLVGLDQRGEARNFNAVFESNNDCDIGSVEWHKVISDVTSAPILYLLL